MGGQDLRQRRHRRGRARGPVRRRHPRRRAHGRRDDAADPALARRRLRHRPADHEHRRHPRDLDRVPRQPRRRRVRHLRRQVPLLAQEPPADAGTTYLERHGPQPQLRLPVGRRRADSTNPQAITYRGPTAFSAPETRAMRDFLASRVVDGRQQIRTAITFHEYGPPGDVAVRLHDHERAGRHDRPTTTPRS